MTIKLQNRKTSTTHINIINGTEAEIKRYSKHLSIMIRMCKTTTQHGRLENK